MLPCISPIIDHRGRQNVVRTSVTHSAITSCATFLFLPHFDVGCFQTIITLFLIFLISLTVLVNVSENVNFISAEKTNWLITNEGVLCYAITFQFSKCVVTFVTTACIPKPELFNWQMCLLSEDTAVLTPYRVILITVTTITTCT